MISARIFFRQKAKLLKLAWKSHIPRMSYKAATRSITTTAHHALEAQVATFDRSDDCNHRGSDVTPCSPPTPPPPPFFCSRILLCVFLRFPCVRAKLELQGPKFSHPCPTRKIPGKSLFFSIPVKSQAKKSRRGHATSNAGISVDNCPDFGTCV